MNRLATSGWPGFALRHPSQLWKRLRLGRVAFSAAPWERIAALAGDHPVVLEAGAADGADTALLSRLLPGASVYALEPVPEAYASLQLRVGSNPRVRTFQLALTDGPEEVLLHLATDSRTLSADSSSLLAPLEHLHHFPEVAFHHTIVVRGTTIDGLIERETLTYPTFMWLDLQGMELPVLEASPKACKRLQALYMEVSRKPLYEGMHLYPEVVQRLGALGFSLEDDRVGPVSGNALFVRR